MSERRADDAEVVLVTASHNPAGSPPGPQSPDVLTAAAGLPGSRRAAELYERALAGSGPAGRVLRAMRRGVRRRWVRRSIGGIAAVAVIASGYHATRGVAPVTPRPRPVEVALIGVPAVIRPCPVRLNCLSTMTVPESFLQSVRASFPTMAVVSRASRYDAAIPEVDVEQVVGRLPDRTALVLTQDRVARGSAGGTVVTETRVPGGVLVARRRGQWLLTAQLSAIAGAAPSRVWLDAARSWTTTASLPR